MRKEHLKTHKYNLQTLYPLIELLSRLCDKDRVIVLEYLNCDGCTAMYECIMNGLHNKAIPKEDRKKIRNAIQSQEKEFKYFQKKNGSKLKKRKELVKVGGAGVGLILESLLPLLTRHISQ